MLFMGEEWGAATPWMYFSDHTDPAIADAVRRGRRAEFAAHGWGLDEVPDPQAEDTFERSRLDWDELARPPHAGLLAWYRALIRLRREQPDLRNPRLDLVRVDHDAAARTVIVHRGSYVVVVNLASHSHTLAVPAGLRIALASDPAATTLDDSRVTLAGATAAVLGPAG
jgi:maltooligosyltrehalose trehalohydrolase